MPYAAHHIRVGVSCFADMPPARSSRTFLSDTLVTRREGLSFRRPLGLTFSPRFFIFSAGYGRVSRCCPSGNTRAATAPVRQRHEARSFRLQSRSRLGLLQEIRYRALGLRSSGIAWPGEPKSAQAVKKRFHFQEISRKCFSTCHLGRSICRFFIIYGVLSLDDDIMPRHAY